MIWFLSEIADKDKGARPKSVDLSKNSTPEKARNIQRFREAVESFGKGHYILIANNPKHVKNIDVLCHVKWCAVFDLDPYSNHTGLLSRIGKKMSENTLLNKFTWQDTKCTITETSLTWIGILGLQDRPDSVISGDFRNWKKKVKSNFDKQLKQILAFSDQYTVLTVVVLWQSGQIECEHMQYMITEILECLSARVVIVLDRVLCTEKKESLIISLFEETENVSVVDLTIGDVCAVIHSECAMTSVVKSDGYHLPTSDETNNPGLSDTQAKWLKEDLDVLYFQNPSDTESTAESLKEQEMMFYRGGSLPWSWWYEVGAGTIDIERDIHMEIVNYIKTRHIKQLKSGYIKLYHNPGSGGTTAAQRVVWHLRHEVPCLQIKHRYESQVPEIFERIKMLYDKTHLPVIVLVDGEEESRADSIFRCLRGHVTIVLLYVQRYWDPISDDVKDNRGSFWLKRVVSKREITPLERQYLNQCTTKQQKDKIRNLSIDVRNGKACTLLEFGLAVYDYQYSGIKNYVAGYMKLNKKETLQKWQKALAYLSFVYFFGQSSLPCNFFSETFESHRVVLTINDLPKEMTGLIVRDNQQKKNNMVRISHYLIAKEILNQVLPFPKPPKEDVSPNLTTEAKRKLADFSVEFIQFASQRISVQHGYVSYVMGKTIISRNNKNVGENETQAFNKKKPPFSPLLEQASMHEPFTERFEILQQLTRSFPLEAQFKAHLGRLYTICSPEKDFEAEKCFQEALSLSLSDGEETDIENLPYGKRSDLMHIYHMYGYMKLTKVSRFTGKYLGDRPHVNTNPEKFEQVSKDLLSLVREACGFFARSRDITPLGSEESMGYICEIHVRLMFASFVNSKGSCESVHHYMDSMNTEEAEFLRESCVVIDELFLECFSAIDPDKMDSNVRTCQEWYCALFKHVPGHLIWNSQHDDLRSRRFEIAKIKMKYGEIYAHGVLERISSASEIQTIVNVYEKNFMDYENGEVPIAKRTMDIEYKEWLIAIRLDLFEDNYPVEKVLKYVEKWNDRLHSPNSRFYLFVLKSILGFGISNRGGNTQLLIEAQHLKEEILKVSKHVTKPKYPREWLGRQQNSIKRLYRGLRFFGKKIDNREFKNRDLELCKGTIFSNDKPTSGYIHLSLGQHNRINVEVFFVPARAEGNLTGSINRNERVEFELGFSMLHGYEAFNVKKLKKIICHKCQIEVDILSNERKAQCPKCYTFVSRNKGGEC